jgi:hypothetical protein
MAHLKPLIIISNIGIQKIFCELLSVLLNILKIAAGIRSCIVEIYLETIVCLKQSALFSYFLDLE